MQLLIQFKSNVNVLASNVNELDSDLKKSSLLNTVIKSNQPLACKQEESI
jgi:hypothetical protein